MRYKKKIVHIVSDPKFVSQIDKFQSVEIENKLIFLGKKGILPTQYDQITVYVSSRRKNMAVVISECVGADLVVVHSLMPSIILRLPKDLKIAWRFFGYEIYERILPKVLSKETFAIYKIGKQRKTALAYMKHIILHFFPKLSLFNRSIARVNYFLGVFEEEYELLKSLGYKLPVFLQIPINPINFSYVQYQKKPVLLLGNSRIFFNNHIDIIKILKEVDTVQNITVKLPFSYGTGLVYVDTIRKEALKLPKVEFIEDFVTRSEFEKIYKYSAAVIINSYRQMALGNIFIALRTGTKIYLSEKNITFHWLKKKQFKISSVESDLSDDIKRGAIFLSETDARYNFEKLIELTNSYTLKDFQHDIREIMNC